jgi:lambda family phage minor tail protein L
MSTRAYDYILQLASTNNFVSGNTIIGLTSKQSAEIVDKDSSNLKIRMSNVYGSFIVGESVISNSTVLTSYNVFSNVTSFVNGTTNTFPLPQSSVPSDSIQVYVNGDILDSQYYVRLDASNIQFIPRERLKSPFEETVEQYTFPDANVKSLIIQTVSGDVEAASFIASSYATQVTTANSSVLAILDNPYISEKNSTQQTPLVKLYTIYYPGEWYAPNANGNPSGSGDSFPWPYTFPMRFAEVVGESYSDFNYAVGFKGELYKVIGIDSGDISVDSTGTIGELSMSISNFDGVIGSIVEDKNLLGYNASNNFSAIVNGELVQNIDPRTIPGNSFFDSNIAAIRGINAAHTYDTASMFGDQWTALKQDSRDMLGAIVTIKLTYAKFLDYWPEYSIVRSSNANSAAVYSSLPYRVGDVVTSNASSNVATVTAIQGSTVFFNNTLIGNIPPGSKLLVVNADADSSSYVEYVYAITRLDELDEFIAKFSLTNWLQYFKMKLPKRKFVNSTCPWRYKGPECKYPQSGVGKISGTGPTVTANGYFTYTNVPTLDVSSDICAKTLSACTLRRNLINFGGFPGLKND